MQKLLPIFLLFLLKTVAGDDTIIEWSKVKLRTEAADFWDNRDVTIQSWRFNPKFKANRIVGGWEVEPHSIPFQAALLMVIGENTYLCGGSIIRENVVLTASHCPEGTERTHIVVGAHQLAASEESQQRITVTRAGYRPHPLYNSRNFNNDIFLFLLPTPVEFNQFVQPIPLPRSEALIAQDFAGEIGRVSGWGRTSDSSWTTSANLRAVENLIITNEECRVFWNVLIIDSTICMRNHGEAACHGDSGELRGKMLQS
jgi:secreted trypsin-like serine protease